MHKTTVSALAAVLLWASVPAHANDYQTVEGTYHYGFAQGVLEDVNLDRTGRGNPALVMTPELVDAAMKRAAELAVLYSPNHMRPNGSKFHTAVPWVGCAGENIAYGWDEPWLAMEAWMESPGHRANILDPKYKYIGVGCFECGETFYWVQVFSGGTKTGGQDTRDGDRTVTVDVGIASGRDSIVRDYTIALKANGGTGKSAVLQTLYGQSVQLPGTPFVRKGFLFLGWATSKKGAVRYKNGATVKNLQTSGGTTVLYAVWAKEQYKVAFYANGGTGKTAAQTFQYGKKAKLRANKFKRKGYVFKGWAKSKALAKKGKVAYKNKQAVKNLVVDGKTVKLYAVWKKK